MRNTVLLDSFLKIVDGFSDTDMTFLLSEVVLAYMAVNSCNGVINWVSETFQNAILTVYEQINPFDPFGQVMCSHFKKLGSPLKCIVRYPYENDQKERYKAAVSYFFYAQNYKMSVKYYFKRGSQIALE